jgi:hypothetical protein
MNVYFPSSKKILFLFGKIIAKRNNKKEPLKKGSLFCS